MTGCRRAGREAFSPLAPMMIFPCGFPDACPPDSARLLSGLACRPAEGGMTAQSVPTGADGQGAFPAGSYE